jgi:hypothetical protein
VSIQKAKCAFALRIYISNVRKVFRTKVENKAIERGNSKMRSSKQKAKCAFVLHVEVYKIMRTMPK